VTSTAPIGYNLWIALSISSPGHHSIRFLTRTRASLGASTTHSLKCPALKIKHHRVKK
jgi:hypothetical protein